MKQEVIERMLIDRSIGGLSPDVKALLTAYLELEPEQQALAEEIDESVVFAKQVLSKPRMVSLPPLKTVPLASSQFIGTSPSRGLWWTGIAASFFLGLSLAAILLQSGPSENPSSRVIAEPVKPSRIMPNEESVSSGFWSFKKLAAVDSKYRAPDRPPVSWRAAIRNSQPAE